MVDISHVRQDYSKAKLSVKHVDRNPIAQFEKWLKEAMESHCLEPTSMIVSTVSDENTPSSRVVLLKGVNSDKFVFFTNYQSRKGSHLAANPTISAVFFWPELERQVNIEGIARKTSIEYSDAYFHTRPWKSRIGARISPQSQPIESRTYLKKLFVQESSKFLLGPIPRPDNWGGYEIEPLRIEFWQGRPSRLHDRVLFTKTGDNAWKIQRLAP
jgi:pyridoxamine 5'-phosphate oxidase